MTTFELSSSEFLIAMPFMSGEDALATQDGTAPFGGANLTGANFTGANFAHSNLEGVNLTGANLTGANFFGADLTGASLENANLSSANFTYANLENANFTYSNLENAFFVHTRLVGTKFYGANLRNANLRNVNLTGAEGIAVIYLPGMSLHGNFLYAVAGETVMFKAGCFWGNEADLRAKVLQEKGESKSARLYLAAIDLVIMALEADGAK